MKFNEYESKLLNSYKKTPIKNLESRRYYYNNKMVDKAAYGSIARKIFLDAEDKVRGMHKLVDKKPWSDQDKTAVKKELNKMIPKHTIIPWF